MAEEIVIGRVYGVFTVVGETAVRKYGLRCWIVRCAVCGEAKPRTHFQIRARRYKSCGCAWRTSQADAVRRHGHAGAVRSVEYAAWRSMIARCENPKHKSWKDYGGRGISVCARWRESFEAFLADVGPRPDGLTLDRHPDTNGNYEPGNVRWATPKEQANNRRNSERVEHRGVSLTVTEWSERLGIGRTTLRYRLASGMSAEEAFSRPIRRCARKGGSRLPLGGK